MGSCPSGESWSRVVKIDVTWTDHIVPRLPGDPECPLADLMYFLRMELLRSRRLAKLGCHKTPCLCYFSFISWVHNRALSSPCTMYRFIFLTGIMYQLIIPNITAANWNKMYDLLNILNIATTKCPCTHNGSVTPLYCSNYVFSYFLSAELDSIFYQREYIHAYFQWSTIVTHDTIHWFVHRELTWYFHPRNKSILHT